jgi:hypothetical protein
VVAKKSPSYKKKSGTPRCGPGAGRRQRRLQLLIPPAVEFSRPFNRSAFSLIFK